MDDSALESQLGDGIADGAEVLVGFGREFPGGHRRFFQSLENEIEDVG